MKKTIPIVVILTLLSYPGTLAHGQGLLKKIKQKAEKVLKQQEEKQKKQQTDTTDESLFYVDEFENEEEPVLGPNSPDAPKLLSFTIGKEKGKFDHEKGTIEITVERDIDFNQIVPYMTATEGASISPKSGQTLNFRKGGYITVRDKEGRKRVYELTLNIRGMEKKDLRTGVKQGTLQMRNTIQGFPEMKCTYYFDHYGKLFAMMTTMGTGAIYDYDKGKITLLSAVPTVEKVKRDVERVANLQTIELKEPTMKELENAMKNGLKEVEFVYDIYEIPHLEDKLECPLISNYEKMPPAFLSLMNARKLPHTTVAGKSCFTLEFADPESGMSMLYYCWNNIHFGGGIRGLAWTQVENFSESVPDGIFLPPKNYRPRAEYQAEINAIVEAAGKKLQQHVQPFMETPEVQALKTFLEAETRAQGVKNEITNP